jgi:PKD repeat protein
LVSLNGASHSVLPLTLEVLDFDLPDENHYKSMVFYGGTGDVRRKHNTGCCTPEMWQTILDYNRMAHRHRLDLIGSGGWTTDLAYLSGTLSGAAYTPAEGYEGPGEGVGNSVFSIATYGGWWGQDQSYYETESDKWVNWFAANAPGVDYFLYLTDEPPPSLYPEIVTRASWIHDNPGPGRNLPVLVTKHPTDMLVGSVDIWSDPTASYDMDVTAAARARGEEVYPYAAYRPKTPADVIDEYGIGYRLKPWIAHKCDISRWFTWESTHWSGNSNELDPGGPKNVWAYPFTFETSGPENNGNGDGTLFYPGRDFDFPEEDRQYPGPVSSYRMKMYRRGAQDVEYMWLAEQAGRGEDVQNLLQDLLPHVMDDALTVPDWSNSNHVYEQARYELAELLGPTAAPSAKFQAVPTRGAGPLTVSFTDRSSFNPTSWAWDFGDGGASTAQHPTHVYSGLGGYSVSLTATNAQGSDTEVRGNCVVVINEVIVYPDSWDTQGGWAPVTLVSGSLADVHDDDGAYMITRCDPTSQRHAILYYADTSYTPDQIARITIEYQGKSSRSDNPGFMQVFVRPSDGNWSNGSMGGWSPGTTDGWYTFETTDVAAIMGSDGILGFELCGCPASASNYDISADVMRFRLELVGGGPMAPVAAFSGSPATGPPPLAVSFTDASANTPTSWSWDFGDGGTSTAQHPSHTFTTGGRHTVTLTVVNARGSDTISRTNYVTATFLDLPTTYWAWASIEACRAAGIVGGYPGGTYRPSETVTRDQMAVYISRALAGGDAGVPTGPPIPSFSDVATDHWAYKHIEYAESQNVVTGYPGGVYLPALPVTRDQMAVFVARAMAGGDAGVPPGPGTATFPDVPIDHWAFKYVEYCKTEGVVGGYGDGTYRPAVTVTRDQMAVYVQRAFALP